MDRAKVFIIDDNVMVRYALKQLLEPEDHIEVVGDSSDHTDIHHEIIKSKANLLVVDIPLPREKGIKRLKDINSPKLPTIVFTRDDQAMVKDIVPLLEAGAVGFVLKPKSDQEITSIREELVAEIYAQLKIDIVRTKTHATIKVLDPLRVVAIGTSTGGPEALSKIITQFPKNFPAGITIVQHMPKDFTPKFAQRLNNMSEITVKEASEGDIIKAGVALLAPGDRHMIFEPEYSGNKVYSKVKLTLDPPQWKLRPTVDKMMTSLVPIYNHNIIGVILTGMGEDGVVGMRAIKESGGRTLVQNEATSVVFGMAQQVIKNNLADETLPLEDIVPRVMELLCCHK